MPPASELQRSRIAGWWADENVTATVLLALALDEFGTEILDWEPITIWAELSSRYNIVVPRLNRDKLMAIMVTLKNNLFYQSVESFTHIANALNDSEADFKTFDPVTAEEAAWAITEVLLNDPPADENINERFSDEVRRFIGAILLDEGITNPPDVLRVADVDPRMQEAADMAFADDPEAHSWFYKLSKEKSEDVAEYVRIRLDGLLNQLDRVPIMNRDPAQWQQYKDRVKRAGALQL